MYKNNPLDAPTGVHNIEKTKPERHFKKSILYVQAGYGLQWHWIIHLNNIYLFFNIPADNTKRKVEYAKQSSSSDFWSLNVHRCCIKRKCKYFFFLKYMNRWVPWPHRDWRWPLLYFKGIPIFSILDFNYLYNTDSALVFATSR